MKKNVSKNRTKPKCRSIDATTTSKDWGFIPVSGKGGKTTNCDPAMPVAAAIAIINGNRN